MRLLQLAYDGALDLRIRQIRHGRFAADHQIIAANQERQLPPYRLTKYTLHAVSYVCLPDSFADHKSDARHVRAIGRRGEDQQGVWPCASFLAHTREVVRAPEPVLAIQHLDRQAVAPLESACLEHPAPIGGGHAGPKAVLASSLEPFWLPCTFHEVDVAPFKGSV